MKRSLIALGFIAATPLAACMVGDTTATLNDDLTFEEFCAYNDALKPVLGLA